MRKFLVSLVMGAVLAAAPVQAAAIAPSPVAKAAFERGEKALEAGRFEDAVTAYTEASTATPNWAPALNGTGSALFKLNRRDEAVAKFRDATAADPAFKLAWFNLGYAARKTQDFATAATAYEKYTALDPGDPDGFYGLGESYKALARADKAIPAYEAYLKKETRASEQKYIDKAKASIAELKAAPPAAAVAPVVAKPEPVAAVTTTPVARPEPVPAPVAVAKPEPAAVDTAAPMPSLGAKKVAEGDKFMAEKKFREASFAYQDAVNADATNVEALFKLGNAYAVLGYYAQAVDRWGRVAQMSGDPAIRKSAEENIARAQQKMATVGGSSPAEQGKVPGTGPVADATRTEARQYYEQGVQLIGQRRYGDALAALNECLRREPALAVGYIARGSTLIGLRRFPEAVTDYQYSLRLDPNLASPLYGLAEAYRGMNRLDDARQYYARYAQAQAPDVRPDLQTDARMKLDQLR